MTSEGSVEHSESESSIDITQDANLPPAPPPATPHRRSPRLGLHHPPQSFLSRYRTGDVSNSHRTTIRTMHDAATHTNGVIRETHVEEVEEVKAGDTKNKKRWKKAVALISATRALESTIQEGNEEEEENEDEEQNGQTEAKPKKVKQYRLTTKRRYIGAKDWLSGQLFLASTTEHEVSQIRGFSYYLTRYLQWTFRTSFLSLFLVSLAFFYIFTLAFAGFFTLFGYFQPECIYVGEGVKFGQNGFGDAFHLSWTTFSTVGYGLVFPDVVGVRQCVLLNMFASFEAYVGVIFVGFTGALVFGKVSRAQSSAKVRFSDPILIQYGSGLMTRQDDVSDTSSFDRDQHGSEEPRRVSVGDDPTGIPCPILEFRVINLAHQFEGGEIMNASVNCSAVLKAGEVAPSIRLAAYKSRRRLKTLEKLRNEGKKRSAATGGKGVFSLATAGHLVGKLKQVATSPLGRTDLPETIEEDEDLDVTTYDLKHQRVTVLQLSALHTLYDEDPTGKFVPRRIFSKVELETPCHPLFRHVWHIQHVLNEKSPLLKAKAKRMVVENGGSWPEELNSHEKVRESIYFEKILVSFSGTASTTANTVYAQKVYHFKNTNVGYRFSPLLHISQQGRLEMDAALLNDVTEQPGGGGEPFQNVEEPLLIPGQHVAEAVVDVAHATGDVVDGAIERIQEVVGSKEE